MTIILYQDQLKYDVDTETRKSGFFQVDHTYQEAMNEAQMGDEDSDNDYFKRRCQQGVDSLIGVLHKFFTSCNDKTTDETKTGSNTLPSSNSWEIVLEFDGRRSVQEVSLASMCHKYVVYHILYNWAVMTMPNLVQTYANQRDAVRLRIQKMVYRKEPPTLSE